MAGGDPKDRWRVVTPAGGELVFTSLMELKEAVMHEKIEPDQTMQASADREPGRIAARTHAARDARRATVVPKRWSAPPMTPSTGTRLLRETPMPAGVRALARQATPAGVFALPAPPDDHGSEERADPPVGSHTSPGLAPSMSRRTMPGIVARGGEDGGRGAAEAAPAGGASTARAATVLDDPRSTIPGIVRREPGAPLSAPRSTFATDPGLAPSMARSTHPGLQPVNTAPPPPPLLPSVPRPSSSAPQAGRDLGSGAWSASAKSIPRGGEDWGSGEWSSSAIDGMWEAEEPPPASVRTASPVATGASPPAPFEPVRTARMIAVGPPSASPNPAPSPVDATAPACADPSSAPSPVDATAPACAPPHDAAVAWAEVVEGLAGVFSRPSPSDDVLKGASYAPPSSRPLPPPSTPVRRQEHGMPDLSEAMRVEIARVELRRIEAPRSTPLEFEERSASDSLMAFEPSRVRRLPKWLLPSGAFVAVACLAVSATLAARRAPSTPPPSSSSVASVEATKPLPVAPASPAAEPAPTVAARARPPSTAAEAIAPAAPRARHAAGQPPLHATAARADAKELRAPTSAPPITAAAADDERQSAYERAVHAHQSGNLAKARSLYRLAVEKEPHNFEAQAGLGDTERAQGDRTAAALAYRRALAENPSFYPALLGLADVLWESGERAQAQERYAEITRRFSPSMYPIRVRQRLNGPDNP